MLLTGLERCNPTSSLLSIYNVLESLLREGNGTPFQCSCLENPMDGGAWWAAVHGVAKSWTRLSDWATSLSCIGEGNGNPLQCSFLENPRDSGAWWAAVHGVAQSWTRLKRLSSSSSRLSPEDYWLLLRLARYNSDLQFRTVVPYIYVHTYLYTWASSVAQQ